MRRTFLLFLISFFVFSACQKEKLADDYPNDYPKYQSTVDTEISTSKDQSPTESTHNQIKAPTPPPPDNPSYFKLSENFHVDTFAENLNGPRVMQFDPKGKLVVSLTSSGKIVALIDENADGKSDKTVSILENLRYTICFIFVFFDEQCTLYVAETDQVSAFDYDPETLKASNQLKILDLPPKGRHFTRTLAWISTNDGEKLLVSVGSSCDVCMEKDERYGAVLISDFDGKNAKIFAKGLRNSVFLTTHPVTGEIWATDMGRDFLGNDLPPDEINILREGNHYGWPFCYGKNIRDKTFLPAESFDCEKQANPSKIDIPAHSSPLGLAFIPEEGWPEDYWYDLLVAYHGSWNRWPRDGYKIVRYKLDEKGNYEGEEDFLTGFLQGNNIVGRPVDIMIQPGGIIYISDDYAGKIYRIAHF